ncbi:peptide-methionine (S)-S-oxide reductase MsrA [Salipaludibacillus sp. LMS25]|uniref:peptide-methionine (S)-S-oxide reductase MsrA n=1 Tax=Salipaludibacillus sp. LMS25 TaxID=2924031 RepID=UPI0020D12B8E|nr:peptide-methionine (S)-S-oxide reductase MsrA [Salipaludibacillus sp. LMS25]UTR14818.1 peptide-methionine (S)-S-oxide reductase MsrA [Salipaludibacillus sp. LMS25]
MTKTYEKATFAGGCFWCMVKPFDEQPGIIKVTSGYTGGDIVNPSYEQVKTGETGHYEAVEIIFDPQLFSYEKLLSLYWPQIDPTDERGQFFDRGPQYRTAIFYHTEAQKKQAEKSRLEVVESGRFSKPIVTKILQAAPFYEAEDEHQTFYKKNPVKYKQEQEESGRKTFIETNWL